MTEMGMRCFGVFMNKKLKKMLAVVSAITVCSISLVSISASALYIPTDKTVTQNTNSFSAIVYGETVNLHLWNEATDYFDDENIKIYISDKMINDYGKEYTYKMISYHQFYQDIDHYSIGLMEFDSYIFDNKDDTAIFEKYLTDNNIAYEKYEFMLDNGAEFIVEQYIETSDGEMKQVYTNHEYFELLKKIKEDTGYTVSWISPASNIKITDVINSLPEPTLSGDTNCDNDVTIADAVLIMQNIANPDEYKITLQGMANADVTGDGDGITLNDAFVIQEMSLNK